MKYLLNKICFWILIVVILFVFGFLMRAPLRYFGGTERDLTQAKASVDSGFLLAVLGGYGDIVSDMIWIKSYTDWEEKNLEKCISNMEMALTINPNNKMFWSMAASILAYDSPHWIVEERNITDSAEIMRVRKVQASKATEYLKRGLEIFPDSLKLLMELGDIYADILGDYDNAIKYYKIAIDADREFIFTRRIYANLLAQSGRQSEALKVLKGVLEELEEGTPIYEQVTLQIKEIAPNKNK